MEDSCPATPLILTGRDSKSPLQVTLSSPESDGIKSPSRDSPDSRCVICLGRLQNKSFTDSCLHQFCFQCLLQWSKVKPVCPLCKQPFKSIIHNVRSNLDYDQYHVERGEPRYVLSDEDMDPYDFDLIPINRRFRYRSTMTRDYFRDLAESFLAHTRRLSENSYQINPLVPVDPAPASIVRRSNRFNSTLQRRTRPRVTTEFRRNIYAQDLWVQDLADISGRYRECSPQFFRENPAQIHRIIPWLNREVNVLLSDCEYHSAYILSRIVSHLTQHPIRSREFREKVRPYFGDRTDHFIHELYAFARSVYDISGFDQNAVYGTNPNYATEVQEILSSTEDDSDIEVLETVSNEERKSKKDNKDQGDTRQGLKKLLLKRASASAAVPQTDEPVAGPSGVTSARICDSIDICESDPDEVKVLDYVKLEPEVLTLSSGDEAPTCSDLDTCNGEYAEVLHSDINNSKLNSQCEDEKKYNRTRNEKGKCKSNGFGLKGKQKRKYIKSRKHRSSSTSSIKSSSSSSSSSSRYKNNKNKNNNSSSSSSSSSGSSSSSTSDDERERKKSNRSRKSSTSSSSSSESDESRSSSSGSRSSYKNSSRARRKKSSICRKKFKKKVIYKSNKKYKSSTDLEKRKKSRVKSCVIVPNWLRGSSSSYRKWRSSPEPKRLQSYWSIALGDDSNKRQEKKRKRKHRDSSSENKSKKRNKRESNSSERTVRSESNKVSSSRSLETNSSGSVDLPSTCTVPSSGTTAFSWPVKPAPHSD